MDPESFYVVTTCIISKYYSKIIFIVPSLQGLNLMTKFLFLSFIQLAFVCVSKDNTHK